MNAKPRADRIVTLDKVLLAEGMCPEGHGRLLVVDIPGLKPSPTGAKQMGLCRPCGAGYVAAHHDRELCDRAYAELATRRKGQLK